MSRVDVHLRVQGDGAERAIRHVLDDGTLQNELRERDIRTSNVVSEGRWVGSTFHGIVHVFARASTQEIYDALDRILDVGAFQDEINGYENARVLGASVELARAKNPEETIMDEKNGLMEKVKSMSAGTKWAIGLGVAALAAAAAWKWWPTSSASSATAPAGGGTTSPGSTTIDPAYSMKPALSIHTDALPMLAPAANGMPGSKYWTLGDQYGQGVGASFDQYGQVSGNAPAQPTGLLDSKNFLQDFATESLTTALPAANLWFLVLGPNQNAPDVTAAQSAIAAMRKQWPNQRILWVLAASTPAAIAQALNQSGEEWVRADTDDTTANDAWNAATAQSIADINKAFPPAGS